MKPIYCICCQEELTGTLDTYGDPGVEMCWECWSGLFDDMVIVNVGCGYFKECHSDNVMKQMIVNGYSEAVKDDPLVYNYEID